MSRIPLREYTGPYTGIALGQIAFPLGGLGAAGFCLAGNGAWRHVSLWHHPQLDHAPMTFATVRVISRKNPVVRLLEGPVDLHDHYTGARPLRGLQGTLPRFEQASFRARFPFASIALRDPALPGLEVELTGWSPFLPGDTSNSSLPVAALDYLFVNHSDHDLDLTFGWHTENFLRAGGTITSQEIVAHPVGLGLRAIRQAGEKELHGAFDVTLRGPGMTIDAAWFRGSFFDARSLLWDAIRSGHQPVREPVGSARPAPGGSLGSRFTLGPGESQRVSILTSWFMPASDLRTGPDPSNSGAFVPWVAAAFPEASALHAHWLARADRLRDRCERFAADLENSTLPPEIAEAIVANLCILRSPTVLRQHDGRLWAWEGCGREHGNWPGTCTHVWGYAQALAHLFPELERAQREVEFLVNQDANGHQNFRTALPIRPTDHTFHAAADGQLGAVVRVHREWMLSGDDIWLRRLWPAVRQSIDWCITEWDPLGAGLPTAPHHTTYDIEFRGPDPLCGTLYVAALTAVVVMGRHLGEKVEDYAELAAKGRRSLEHDLFNGRWLEQGATPDTPLRADPRAIDRLAPSPEVMAYTAAHGPRHQFGRGLLSDGVMGVWLADLAGLPEILDPGVVAAHLDAVATHNFQADFSNEVSAQRWHFAAGSEGGLRLCSWPDGDRPPLPFVYSDEVWTGVEYQVASHLIRIGDLERGCALVRAVRQRYDGRWRNPFGEEEAGVWYGRALASYALLQACTGVRYDPREQILHLSPQFPGDWQCFFACEGAWGIVGFANDQPFVTWREGSRPVRNFRCRLFGETSVIELPA